MARQTEEVETIEVDTEDIIGLGTPTFTPQPSCTEDIYNVLVSTYSCGKTACRYLHLGETTSTSDCMPTDWREKEIFLDEWVSFQSPGVCPQGYTFACAKSLEGKTETTATCCPRCFKLGYPVARVAALLIAK